MTKLLPLDAQSPVNTLCDFKTHIVGHRAVVVVVEVGINDNRAVRRESGHQQSLVEGQAAIAAIGVRTFLMLIHVAIGHEVTEQLGLADAVMTIAVARSFGAMRNDAFCARAIENSITEIVLLTLGVVTPVGRARGSRSTANDHLYPFVEQGSDKGIFAADGETLRDRSGRVDLCSQQGILGRRHLQDV